MYDGSGKSRGFGFVSFEEPEAAERVGLSIDIKLWLSASMLWCGSCAL